MDRFAWYSADAYREEQLFSANNIDLCDGDKKPTFVRGTLVLTGSSLIWTDATKPNYKIVLYHSLVKKISTQKYFLRGKEKIIELLPIPFSTDAHTKRPIASSSYDFIRLVFHSSGEDEFYQLYEKTLNKWRENSTKKMASRGGISGIERRVADEQQKSSHNIAEAFEDMTKLMEHAQKMVAMSKKITDYIKVKKGEVTDDEVIKFKSELMRLGIDDPVTKDSVGDKKFYQGLARELDAVLLKTLEQSKSDMITLADAYCRINRARGVDLVSPEDVLKACQKLPSIGSLLCLHTFQSGVSVIRLKSASAKQVVEDVCSFIESLGGHADASKIARHFSISSVIATERLLMAEENGMLCRDDTVEGLVFYYPNKFLLENVVD